MVFSVDKGGQFFLGLGRGGFFPSLRRPCRSALDERFCGRFICFFLCCGLSGLLFLPALFCPHASGYGPPGRCGMHPRAAETSSKPSGTLRRFFACCRFLAGCGMAISKHERYHWSYFEQSHVAFVAAPELARYISNHSSPASRVAFSVPNRKSIFMLIATPLRAISTCMILPPTPCMRLQ